MRLKNTKRWNDLQRLLKVIGNVTLEYSAYGFLLQFHSEVCKLQLLLWDKTFRSQLIRILKQVVAVATLDWNPSSCSRWPQSAPEILTFCRNSIWRPPPCWVFMISEFGTFRRDGCLLLELSTKQSVRISRTIAENDMYLFQTFDSWRHVNKLPVQFWSRGHLRVVVLHLSTKLNLFHTNVLSSTKTLAFSKLSMSPSAILDLLGTSWPVGLPRNAH